MKKLSPDDLRSRLRFDYQVCQALFNASPVISGKAYRNTSDLEQRRNQITSLSEGHRALYYRVDFHVRTLIGPERYSNVTTIKVNINARNYPYQEPPCWVISTPIPYSPHFEEGKSICIGDIWEKANGRMMLGELLIHIARILNWDNTTDWEYDVQVSEAARYYRRVHGEKPINPSLRYPQIPSELFGGSYATAQWEVMAHPSLFEHIGTQSVVRSDLFRGIGIE